jgi:GTP:adenosylcobinamide-phosphate guanylyltransferase
VALIGSLDPCEGLKEWCCLLPTSYRCGRTGNPIRLIANTGKILSSSHVLRSWDALVLAAGRGPDDPLSRAFSVTHKCLLPLAGKPMLQHVINGLNASARFNAIAVSIEDPSLLRAALGPLADAAKPVVSAPSASLSVAHAFATVPLQPPILVTTGDHPLLRQDIIGEFLDRSAASGADLTVGLATAEVILSAYPEARRTFLHFGRERVSGCNLFAFNTSAAIKVIDHWHQVEKSRKRPWRLVRSFGLAPLLRYAIGALSLKAAFSAASRALDLTVEPILLPFAESAIDIDKPADLELAEKILRSNNRYQPAIM